MVICCVPGCGTDSWRCDGSVTFYDFPSNPDLKAKWIKQVNTAIKASTMWFPRGRPVICSKHFLQTDFKGDTDALRSRCIPTVFGHKYIGQNPESNEINMIQEVKTSPLIVKVLKPQSNVTQNDSNLRISTVCSQANSYENNDTVPETQIPVCPQANSYENNDIVPETQIPVCSQTNSYENNDIVPETLIPVDESNFQSSSTKSTTGNDRQTLNISSMTKTTKKPNTSESLQQESNSLVSNGITINNGSKKFLGKQANLLPKTPKKKECNNDLIEIGPNTFLKINPDVIKVNKKQTPSGNTVLQFLMDQKLAKNYSGDLLPKIIQSIPVSSTEKNNSDTANGIESPSNNNSKDTPSSKQQKETVQHVLGHVVDNHICEDSCNDLSVVDDEPMDVDVSHNAEMSTENQGVGNSSNEHIRNVSFNDSEESFIEKAPVLLTTNMPLSHCFIDRPKYTLQLKQKNRQIAALKVKVSTLNKKIEDLEDRCVVQERQLSYSFIKRLRAIRKNAGKGDPSATYILEQIRSYTYVNNSKMRWSDSTLTQCAIWCRKAPYAYEYFKKAGFFKLPCLGTVKRFMKKHPEIKFQKSVTKSEAQAEDGNESSSDFDFDDSDGQNDNGMSEDENDEGVTSKTILSEMADDSATQNAISKKQINGKENNEIQKATESISNHSPELNGQNVVNEKTKVNKSRDASKCVESSTVPVTVDTSNLELQEIMLPSGEVVQCYTSNIVSGTEGGQYFIIPNVNDQSSTGEHGYNVVQTDSMPVILQNAENSHTHVQQDQLIFIANSSDQVECSETEVISA